MPVGWVRRPDGDSTNISTLSLAFLFFKVQSTKHKVRFLEMNQPTISHYCQKCRAANPMGQEFCLRCGTRLMIVVQPPSVRVDVAETTPQEEHLLERLTLLENTLARLAERLEEGLKLLLRHSETSYVNHALVKSLIEMLHESGIVDSNSLESTWRAECEKLQPPGEETKPGKRKRRPKQKRETPK